MAKKAKQRGALPKTIAGVRVPKQLRKTGKAALKLSEHPVVSDVVTAALLAAAASLVENKRVRGAAKAVGGEAGDMASGTAREAGRIAAALSAAAGAAGKALLDAVEDLAGENGNGKGKGKNRG